MADLTSKRMLNVYKQEATPKLFIQGFFQTPEKNFHNSEKVEYDIVRSDEDVAVAVQR